MHEARPSPLLRFFPSLTDVAFLLPLSFVFFTMGGATRLLEGDTGWHIRAGEWILANGRVPDRDFFSFTKAGEPWFAWEWLWDVCFAWMHGRWGMEAVVFVSLAVICLTSALLYRLLLRKAGNPLVAIAFTWLAMAASSIHWWARPHVFTLLFTVVFYDVLDRRYGGGMSRLWLLPLLTVLWTNLHGGFVAGLVLIGFYAAGEVIAAAVAGDAAARREALRRSLPYWWTGAACLAATLVNPYSWRLHVHVVKLVGDPNSPLYRWVSEWFSIQFRPGPSRYFEILIVLAVATALWYAGRRRFAYSLLLLGWLHQALVAARNIPIFAIVAAPLAAGAAVEVLAAAARADVARWVKRVPEFIRELGAELTSFEQHARLHLASAAGLILVAALLWAPQPPKRFRAAYDPEQYPVEAINKLGPERLAGKLFSTDEWSDYVIYRLYPATKVFMDGRLDLYGARFLEEYSDLWNGKSDFEKVFNKYGIQTVLLPRQTLLAAALKASGHWSKVYEDRVAVLFRAAPSRPSGEGLTSSIAGDGIGSHPGCSASGPGSRTIVQLHEERSEQP
jgi:hypothetical protein